MQAYAASPTQNPVAGGAGQDRAGKRRRRELVATDDEQIGRRRLREEPVGRQEDGVVGTRLARFDAGENIVRTGRRLQPDERVLRVAAHGARDEVETVLEVAE